MPAQTTGRTHPTTLGHLWKSLIISVLFEWGHSWKPVIVCCSLTALPRVNNPVPFIISLSQTQEKWLQRDDECRGLFLFWGILDSEAGCWRDCRYLGNLACSSVHSSGGGRVGPSFISVEVLRKLSFGRTLVWCAPIFKLPRKWNVRWAVWARIGASERSRELPAAQLDPSGICRPLLCFWPWVLHEELPRRCFKAHTATGVAGYRYWWKAFGAFQCPGAVCWFSASWGSLYLEQCLSYSCSSWKDESEKKRSDLWVTTKCWLAAVESLEA